MKPRRRRAGPHDHAGRPADRRARPAQRRPADRRGAGDLAHHRLEQLHSLVELAPALRRAGRAEEADAAAKRVLSDASAMGALALVGRLAQHEGDGR